jgi:carbon dioxide concentrating mechanism protein CcmL
MRLARVIGMAVSTVKDVELVGSTLLVCRPCDVSGVAVGEEVFVATDTVGAGVDDIVLVALGSAARVPEQLRAAPNDAAVVGIVDSINSEGITTVVKGGGTRDADKTKQRPARSGSR